MSPWDERGVSQKCDMGEAAEGAHEAPVCIRAEILGRSGLRSKFPANEEVVPEGFVDMRVTTDVFIAHVIAPIVVLSSRCY